MSIGEVVRINYPAALAHSMFQGNLATVVRRKSDNIWGMVMVETVRLQEDGEVHDHLYEEGQYLETQRDTASL